VDLLLSFPPTSGSSGTGLPAPNVTLLEFNASPDFFQSGERLKSELSDMFKDVVRLVIAPFFDLELIEDEDDSESGPAETPNKAEAWILIGEEKTRGEW
jgi:tubulin--tyrosine ligase